MSKGLEELPPHSVYYLLKHCLVKYVKFLEVTLFLSIILIFTQTHNNKTDIFSWTVNDIATRSYFMTSDQ